MRNGARWDGVARKDGGARWGGAARSGGGS